MTLVQAVDLVVLYLRIVHSVDFYWHGEYANEDNMPNRFFDEERVKCMIHVRCGLVHVRGQPPSGSTFETDSDGKTLITAKFVADTITANETAVTVSFLP